MPTKYVTSKTAQLYENSTERKNRMVLIFGDKVKTSGAPDNGRIKTRFRDRNGFISVNNLGSKPALEMYFIDVGQGDSTFIVTPKRKKILIDGGANNRAYGFLSWKYMLEKGGDPIDIDLLVLSHADGDHIDGLSPIIRHPMINVKQVVHNGIATFKKNVYSTTLGKTDSKRKYLLTRHDGINDLAGLSIDDRFGAWYKAIKDEGTQYMAVDSTVGNIDIGDPDISIEVLGPRLDNHKGKSAYRWFKKESLTINGHSVVLRLKYKNVSALFAGDINADGAKYLLEDTGIAASLTSHIFKAPHHGSHDFHMPFLETIKPQISIISSGDEPDHGHPRANFIGSIGRVSRINEPLVFSTEIAATFAEEKRVKRKPGPDENPLESLDAIKPENDSVARRAFKQRLHGMINIRTDGDNIYAARRVAAGYWWESYGPVEPSSG